MSSFTRDPGSFQLYHNTLYAVEQNADEDLRAKRTALRVQEGPDAAAQARLKARLRALADVSLRLGAGSLEGSSPRGHSFYNGCWLSSASTKLSQCNSGTLGVDGMAAGRDQQPVVLQHAVIILS